MSEATPFSIRAALAGRHILLTGGSGFVGKVWLSMALQQLPEIERIYVFLRPKALVPARQRFEKMINCSPAFQPLHDRFGPQLSAYLADRLEVIEGELTAPDLGLAPGLARRLKRDVDVFIHCAGLVDFNPDLRRAIESNVDATMRVADFVEQCDHASLLHISTCYVAGRRYGEIEERVPETLPNGEPFDAERELADARERVDTIVRAHAAESLHRQLRERVLAELREQGRRDPSAHLLETLTRKKQREELKEALAEEGMERADQLGWPNTYTYTKSLAEALLSRRCQLRCSILRPSIVESALEYPLPGWNESFNGSAPLAYIMGSWFRLVPARPDAPFDVVPVDLVARAMTIASAALAEDRHEPVYHVGTSDLHSCSVGRAAELIVLSHRRHLRQAQQSRTERVLKSRWDAILVGPDEPLGIKGVRSLVRGFDEAVDLLPRKLQKKLKRVVRKVHDADEDFAQLEKVIGMYMPFMYESLYVFKSRALGKHPPLEREFSFDPSGFDWRSYFLDVHMPGLRRWAFPLIEGKRPERYRAAHVVRLHDLKPHAHSEEAVLASPAEAE
jgi:nucleoside-diphosphate-sugar epimerase